MLKDDPPRPGDYVRVGSGEARRVSKVTSDSGDCIVHFEGGGSAHWKKDGIIIISRDESFREYVEDLRNRCNTELSARNFK